MALTTFRAGAPSVAGFRTHTNNWNTTNTGVALTTGDAFEMLPSGSPRTSVVDGENLALAGGTGIQRRGVKAGERFNGELTANLAYGHLALWRMVGAFFGAETTTSLGSGAYSHLFTFGMNTEIVGNLAWTDNLECHDIPMTKIRSLMFALNAGTLATAKVGVVGKRELRDGSGLNTLSGVNSGCTLPTSPTIVYPVIDSTQCVARIAAASAGSLSSAEAIGVNSLEISFGREYAERQTTLNGPYIDEPVVGAWKPIGFKFGIPIDTVTGQSDWMVNMTDLKADITLTGSAIAGSAYSWTIKWEFPCVRLDTSGLAQLNTPDLPELSFDATCYRAASAPTGMAFTEPRLTLINTSAINHITNET